jgi:hypothetical protein
MSFEVLHPGSRWRSRSFSNGPGNPEEAVRPPEGILAYAACRNGSFHPSLGSLPETASDVLLVLDKKNLRQASSSLQFLRRRGVRVRVVCRESRAGDFAELLGDVTRCELFIEICRSSDGAIATTSESVSLFESIGSPQTQFIPHPCAVDFPSWDFSQPPEKRRGIFLGTNSFLAAESNHTVAILMADRLSRELECPLAVVNTEGRRGGMILKSLRKKNPLFFIVEAPIDYADLLRVMSLHRIVWQLDAGCGPGTIASAALLCRIPCVGGNGAIERIAFPGLCSPASREELLESARLLLTDDKAWKKEVEASQYRAAEFLSFHKTSVRLSTSPSDSIQS